MNWQLIVGSIGYVGVVVFVLLWRLERSRHKTTRTSHDHTLMQLATAEARIEVLKRQKEAEREALNKLQESNEKMQAAIDALPSASRDDLLEFMRNGSPG